jgi:hypothetical protein
LGERLNGIQEVGGSIPPGSTIRFQTNAQFPASIPNNFDIAVVWSVRAARLRSLVRR